MTDINKQKFLAELGKLLTFMYEEDRQTALDMYGEIFDQADDIQALMNHLVSPTRQAVVIARAYNAKERKLQIYSQSRDEDEDYSESDEAPAFVQAIADMLPYAVKHEEEAVSADQFSFFDNGQNPVIQEEETEEAEDVPAEDAPEEPEEALPAQEAEAEPEARSVPEEPAAGEAVPLQENGEAETEEDELSALENEISGEELHGQEVLQEAEPDEIPEEQAEDTASEPESEEAESEEEASVLEEAEPAEEPEEAVPAAAAEETAEPQEAVYVTKPRIFLLILYIIFAAPITAAGLVILSIPTLLLFAVSIGVIIAAGLLMRGAFSGLSTAADIMVLIGCSVIGFALGLLLLWSFIWFIGGAMSGFVRAILNLGKKWCYKEVQVI